jgi:prepilin-type N-terminal cleavage/methylation domain-containing protein
MIHSLFGRKDRLLRRKGFTLIELLVVIVILAILMAIAIPAYLSQQKKAKDSEAKQYLTTAWKSARAALIDNSSSSTYPLGATMVSAINQDQPQLTITAGSCGSAAGMAKQLVLDTSSTAQNLIICSKSASGTLYKMQANATDTPAFSAVVGIQGFNAKVDLNTGSADPGFNGIAVGDFNGDGKIDVAGGNWQGGGNGIYALAGNGTGGFPAAWHPTSVANAQAWQLATADFNGDGKMDVVSANDNSASVSVYLGNAATLLNNGIQRACGATTYGVATGDLNNDGNQDIVVTLVNGNIAIILGNGNGTFVAAATFASGVTPNYVSVSDINADGKQDLVLTSSGGLRSFLGNGDGTFAAGVTQADTTVGKVALGDFNGDGKIDAVTSGIPSMAFLAGNGDGTFGLPTYFSQGNDVKAADLSGDGKLDLVIADAGANIISYMTGKGDGSFNAPTNVAVANAPNSVVLGDANKDGFLDVLVARGANPAFGYIQSK